ncbi:MAG: flagellin lysine-N-methylase [Spirochaetaceae bacterium]|nr:flagellin lysine-N-methylase [Spirochaetaceae bacterium]
MKKKTKILIPSYAEDFLCIGGACKDSCCIGWNIDIDKKTFRNYFRTKNTEMKKMFFEYLYRNEKSYNNDVDYGQLAIKDSKWCPFLDEDKLCSIYKNLGEDLLSNVCYSFPRVYNVLNGVYELSLSMSCPEAVRKLLSSQNPITFTERDLLPVKHIIHSSVDTGKKYWNKTPIKRLPELRSRSIGIIQNRSHSINERLLKLGAMLEESSQREPITIKSKSDFKIEFFQYAIESLGVIDEIDSPVFAANTSLVLEKFVLPENKSSKTMSDFYKEIVETVVKPFTEENAYMFENYLVNFIYQDNFPFSENQNMFDGYVMLIVRYTFIQFYLAGIAAQNGKLTKDDVVLMIQTHTKIINHHKTFLINLLQEIHRKQYDNREFISLLLN